jgi:hypothetical protein
MSYPSDEAIAARMLDLTSSPTPAESVFNPSFSRRVLPLGSMFAWERGRPDGEGQAGDYLTHLRAQREAGTLPTTSNEELSPMSNPSVTITVAAPDVDTLMQAVLDLAASDDVTVQLYQRPQIVRGDDEGTPGYGGAIKRIHIDRDDPTLVREYLVKVCQRNEHDHSDLLAPIKIQVEYEAGGTGERTRREISPLRIEDRQMSIWSYQTRQYLIAMDVAKDAPRTFLVDNILSVDGPAL